MIYGWLWSYHYCPQRSCEGYVFTRVCHSVHRGVCLGACWDTTPRDQAPPRSRHPTPDQAPPPQEQTPRTRHPPGADTQPQTRHPPPPGADPPDQAPPPGADIPPPDLPLVSPNSSNIGRKSLSLKKKEIGQKNKQNTCNILVSNFISFTKQLQFHTCFRVRDIRR